MPTIMSNPTISATEFIKLNVDSSLFPGSYLFTNSLCDEVWKKSIGPMYKTEKVIEMVERANLNVVLREGVNIPKDLNRDPRVLNRKKEDGTPIPVRDELASTSTQSALFRKLDTSVGLPVARRIFEMLPEVGAFFDKKSMYAKAADMFGVGGGPAICWRRLEEFLPKRGAVLPRPLTRAEVDRGMESMGLNPSKLRMGPRMEILSPGTVPLPGDAIRYVKLNSKAGTGFPTLGKMSDPVVTDIVLRIVEEIRGCEDTGESDPYYHRMAIQAKLRELDRKYPYMFLSQGKMKADVYSGAKVQGLQARYYAVVPAGPKIVMMQAVQAAERDKRTVWNNTPDDHFNGTGVHTFSGMDLGPTGLHALVTDMETQLRLRGYCYLHMGDDTWIFFRLRNGWISRFALDAKSFDLTQQGALNASVDEALFELFEHYDPLSAGVYKYMTSHKRVALMGTVVAEMKDASLSGMNGVSIKNGVIFNSLIERVAERVLETLDDLEHVGFDDAEYLGVVELQIAQIVESEGRGLGLQVKLEQYEAFRGTTVTETLLQKPDKFVGYQIYAETFGGKTHVFACCDMERFLAQLRHPQFKWYTEMDTAKAVNTIRVASTLLGVGDPHPDVMPAVMAGMSLALEYLDALIADVQAGTIEDPFVTGEYSSGELAVIAEGELGLAQVNFEKSVQGLRRALARVMWKNQHLEACRGWNQEYKVNDLDYIVLPEYSDDYDMKVPRRRPTVFAMKPVQVGVRKPERKHIGKRPPTALPFSGSSKKFRVHEAESADMHADAYDEDDEETMGDSMSLNSDDYNLSDDDREEVSRENEEAEDALYEMSDEDEYHEEVLARQNAGYA